MGIERIYNRIIHKELGCRAAWPPIANSFAVGDYGLISGGRFTMLGNIQRDFGVAVDVGPDSGSTKLDFTSEGATIGRVAADGKVNIFPETAVDASLVVDFKTAQSVMLRSSEVVTREMRNAEVAAKALRHKSGWKMRYRVVRAVWHANHPLVLTTREASTKVTFAAKAEVLRKLDVGNVAVDIHVGSDKSVGFEFVGKAGVIGLGLFRVRVAGGGAAGVRGVVDDVDRDDDDLDELDDDV